MRHTGLKALRVLVSWVLNRLNTLQAFLHWLYQLSRMRSILEGLVQKRQSFFYLSVSFLVHLLTRLRRLLYIKVLVLVILQARRKVHRTPTHQSLVVLKVRELVTLDILVHRFLNRLRFHIIYSKFIQRYKRTY